MSGFYCVFSQGTLAVFLMLYSLSVVFELVLFSLTYG